MCDEEAGNIKDSSKGHLGHSWGKEEHFRSGKVMLSWRGGLGEVTESRVTGQSGLSVHSCPPSEHIGTGVGELPAGHRRAALPQDT